MIEGFEQLNEIRVISSIALLYLIDQKVVLPTSTLHYSQFRINVQRRITFTG